MGCYSSWGCCWVPCLATSSRIGRAPTFAPTQVYAAPTQVYAAPAAGHAHAAHARAAPAAAALADDTVYRLLAALQQAEAVQPSQNQIVIIGGDAVPYVTTDESAVDIAPTPPLDRTLTKGELEEIICIPKYSWSCAEALAVVSCESTNRAAVVGAVDEIGIWQIHPVHEIGLDAYDPVKATEFAYELYSHREWLDWLGLPPFGRRRPEMMRGVVVLMEGVFPSWLAVEMVIVALLPAIAAIAGVRHQAGPAAIHPRGMDRPACEDLRAARVTHADGRCFCARGGQAAQWQG